MGYHDWRRPLELLQGYASDARRGSPAFRIKESEVPGGTWALGDDPDLDDAAMESDPEPLGDPLEDSDREDGSPSDPIFRPEHKRGHIQWIQRPARLRSPKVPASDNVKLYERWRQAPAGAARDEALEHLYNANQDFLHRQVQSLSSFRLPAPYLKAKVYNAFQQALEDWNPASANLHTFFKAAKSQNLKRDARQLAQFAKAERTRVSKVERVRQIASKLEFEQNKVPTAEEIARAALPGELKVQDVELILRESRGDLLSSRVLSKDDNQDTQRSVLLAVRRVRDLYPDQQRKILDHLWGLDGAPVITSNGQLAKKFNISDSQMSLFKRKFRADLEQELRFQGV